MAGKVITYHHGQALFEAAHESQTFLEMSGGHNDSFYLAGEIWTRELGSFLDRYVGNPAMPAPAGN